MPTQFQVLVSFCMTNCRATNAGKLLLTRISLSLIPNQDAWLYIKLRHKHKAMIILGPVIEIHNGACIIKFSFVTVFFCASSIETTFKGFSDIFVSAVKEKSDMNRNRLPSGYENDNVVWLA